MALGRNGSYHFNSYLVDQSKSYGRRKDNTLIGMGPVERDSGYFDNIICYSAVTLQCVVIPQHYWGDALGLCAPTLTLTLGWCQRGSSTWWVWSQKLDPQSLASAPAFLIGHELPIGSVFSTLPLQGSGESVSGPEFL